MGFITMQNSAGREVFACEIGAEGCVNYPCRAHHCPFGWCQRYYVCKNCWNKLEVKKRFSKAGHEERGCKKAHEDYTRKQTEAEELRIAGHYLRVAALDKDALGIQVLFRRNAGEELGVYMPAPIYDAIPIGINATLEDYQTKAKTLGYPTRFKEAPTHF